MNGPYLWKNKLCKSIMKHSLVYLTVILWTIWTCFINGTHYILRFLVMLHFFLNLVFKVYWNCFRIMYFWRFAIFLINTKLRNHMTHWSTILTSWLSLVLKMVSNATEVHKFHLSHQWNKTNQEMSLNHFFKSFFLSPTLQRTLDSVPRSLLNRVRGAPWWERHIGWLRKSWHAKPMDPKSTSGPWASWLSRWWKENRHTSTRIHWGYVGIIGSPKS